MTKREYKYLLGPWVIVEKGAASLEGYTFRMTVKKGQPGWISRKKRSRLRRKPTEPYLIHFLIPSTGLKDAQGADVVPAIDFYTPLRYDECSNYSK